MPLNKISRENSIRAQIKRAAELLPKIEEEYQNSLHAQSIDEELKLDIQTFCGHLRSALDYLAKDIVETHCPNANPRKRLYFPITSDAASFSNTMNQSYTDLSTNCTPIFNLLERIQPYQSNENKWLTQFNNVNNENKHNDLVEQTRTETKTVEVKNKQGGGSVSWGSGVTFGSGVNVMGVPIDPRTQMPVPNNTTTTKVTTWVDFKFDGINVSVIGLLKHTLNEITSIADEIINEL
jgi:hypothetical protein